jgi:hypothetical protein
MQLRQIVLVAAGYDTRAYRLAQPGITFFEVDLPSASERKQKLVAKLGCVSPEVTKGQARFRSHPLLEMSMRPSPRVAGMPSCGMPIGGHPSPYYLMLAF